MENIEIRRVRNGFIVIPEPKVDSSKYMAPVSSKETWVFHTVEELAAWITGEYAEMIRGRKIARDEE